MGFSRVAAAVGCKTSTRICLAVAAFFWLPVVQAQPNELVINGAPRGSEAAMLNQVTRLQFPCVASIARVRAVVQRNQGELTDLLSALGYYQSEFEIEPVQSEGCTQIRIDINAGEQTRYTSVGVEILGDGVEDPAFALVLQQSVVRTGAVVDHQQYETLKSDLRRTAFRRGYFDDQFVVSQLRVDPVANQVEVVIQYDTGVRYRYGDVIYQQTAISAELMERFSTLQEDGYYNAGDIQQFQQSMLDSRYFSSAVVRPLIDERADGRVTIEVEGVPMNRWRYESGIGVATDTGPNFTLGVTNRWVTDAGQRASFELSLAESLRIAEFSYSIPLEDPTRELMQYQVGIQQVDTGTATARQISAGVNRIKVHDNNWVRSLSLDYNIETTDIGIEDFSSRLLIPGIGYVRTESTGDRRVSHGWRLALDVQGSTAFLLSDLDFLQIRAEGKKIMPLGKGRILTRVQLGTTLADQLQELPASLRFFAGGDNSIRGYAFESVGPTDEFGDVVGGRHLIVGSLEYAHPVRENWDVAVFLDAGNAFDLQKPEFERGVGFGVRWHSIIGTLRFDLATNGDGVRLHVFVGPEL